MFIRAKDLKNALENVPDDANIILNIVTETNTISCAAKNISVTQCNDFLIISNQNLISVSNGE